MAILHSERILLRPVELEDVLSIARWRNRPDIHEQFFSIFPLALSGQEAWYRTLLATGKQKLFIICALPQNQAIGTIGFDHIDWKNQRAEFGNMLIGEDSWRGLGLAREATMLLLEFGFQQMNLNRVYLEVYASNERAVGVYKDCGFEIEGVLRETYFSGGRYQDTLLMAVLRRRWTEARGK